MAEEKKKNDHVINTIEPQQKWATFINNICTAFLKMFFLYVTVVSVMAMVPKALNADNIDCGMPKSLLATLQ